VNTLEVKKIDESETMQLLQSNNSLALTAILRDIVPAIMPLLHIHINRLSLSNEDVEEVIAISLASLWHQRKHIKGDLQSNLYLILRNSMLNFRSKNHEGC